MPEFYMILARKVIKIAYPNIMIFAGKIKKIPEFYMIFARKMPDFYIRIGQNIFPELVGGGTCLSEKGCNLTFCNSIT